MDNESDNEDVAQQAALMVTKLGGIQNKKIN